MRNLFTALTDADVVTDDVFTSVVLGLGIADLPADVLPATLRVLVSLNQPFVPRVARDQVHVSSILSLLRSGAALRPVLPIGDEACVLLSLLNDPTTTVCIESKGFGHSFRVQDCLQWLDKAMAMAARPSTLSLVVMFGGSGKSGWGFVCVAHSPAEAKRLKRVLTVARVYYAGDRKRVEREIERVSSVVAMADGVYGVDVFGSIAKDLRWTKIDHRLLGTVPHTQEQIDYMNAIEESITSEGFVSDRKLLTSPLLKLPRGEIAARVGGGAAGAGVLAGGGGGGSGHNGVNNAASAKKIVAIIDLNDDGDDDDDDDDDAARANSAEAAGASELRRRNRSH